MSTPRRYYEDLVIGETRVSGTHTLTTQEVLDFARQYDPQYFHADEVAARDSVFGTLVASGIHTMAVWRQLDHQIAHDIAWICGVAWDEVRWPKAMRPGDTLHARAECLSKRESRSDPQRGVVVFHYQLLDQDETLIWEAKSTNLIERRPA